MTTIDNAQRGDEFDWATFNAHLRRLSGRWRLLVAALVVGGCAGYGISFAMRPTYQAAVLFIPPQQQSGSSAAAMAALGALASYMGGAGSTKTPADQYVTMLESKTISNAIIKRFGLQKLYGEEYLDYARNKLARRVNVDAGKKDGMIRVEVEDVDPKRAADMANAYVDELHTLISHLAVTEAQQRRVFFGHLLDETKAKLVQAQVTLEATGFSAGALKSEPKSAADTYARLRAELTAAQVRLQVLQSAQAETAPAVVTQRQLVQALSEQLDRLEATQAGGKDSPDYVGKYRDYKYQETLFELYAKQYELARADEAREGALIQVVDPATPPEHRHFPRRALFAALGSLLGLAVTASRVWRGAGRAGVGAGNTA